MGALDDPWAPVAPAFVHVPKWDYTLGAEVADLCALLGYAPDPEQEVFLDAVFGVRSSDGLPACEEATEIAGRQNLKTGEITQTELGWLFLTKEQRILHSAHEFSTSRDSFLLLRSLIEKKSWANNLVRQFYASASFMGIVLTDGRMLEFAARTTNQGRGKSAPKAIWDEGLELRPEHLGAQDAIKSTYPWAQTLIASSACKPYSEVLRAKVDKLRAQKMGPREFGREFCDDLPGGCALGDECTHVIGTPGCRLDSVDRWKRTNPALGRIRPDGRGLTVAAIQRERRNQPQPLIFARERLGWHDELAVGSLPVFSEETWDGLRDRHSSVPDAGLVFGLHVSPLRDWSAIAFGGRTGAGRVHVETASRSKGGVRTYFRRPSTDWVVPWFRSRLEPAKGKPKFDEMTLVVWAGTAVDSLLPKLSEIRGVDIVELPRGEQPAACGHFQDLVSGGDLVHVGDPEMRASVTSIARRPMGESSFVWSPRSSAGDITAAYAATGIAWHLANTEDYDPLDSVG